MVPRELRYVQAGGGGVFQGGCSEVWADPVPVPSPLPSALPSSPVYTSLSSFAWCISISSVGAHGGRSLLKGICRAGGEGRGGGAGHFCKGSAGVGGQGR